MLLNNTLRFLLAVPKHHDNIVLIKKITFNVKDNVHCRGRKFNKYIKLIMNYTRLTDKQANYLLVENPHLLEKPENRIIECCTVCKKHKVSWEELNYKKLDLFDLSKQQLNSRCLILKELGVKKLSPAMLNSSSQYVKANIFRIYANICESLKFEDNLYNYLHEPPPDVPPIKLDENLPLRTFRMQCLAHYLQWRLEILNKDDKNLHKLAQSLLHMNFAAIRKTFDFLHYEVGLPIEMIREENCLDGCDVEELKKIIGRLETICGIPFSELILFSPSLCRMKYTNTLHLKSLLEKHKFTGEQLKNCANVLLVDKENISSGLKLIREDMKIKMFKNHPLVLHLFMMKDELNMRVKYLEYLNMNNASITILTRTNSQFDKSLRSGNMKNRFTEVKWIFEQHTSLDPEYIHTCLTKHPFWNKVNLLTIYQTLEFLLAIFNIDDLKDNLSIVLYSRQKVVTTMEMLAKDYKIFDSEYTVSQIIALCEYEIEKNYHFSGDGVWEKSGITNDVSIQFLCEWTDWRARQNPCKNHGFIFDVNSNDDSHNNDENYDSDYSGNINDIHNELRLSSVNKM